MTRHKSLGPSAWFLMMVGISVFFSRPIKAETPGPGPAGGGVTIHYQLPTEGPLPKTYLVTLAAVDPKNPNWIVSTFAAGLPCTVTAENEGKFTALWNGLDENYMPVPPGEYAFKGIYSPAEIWPIDGQAHAIVPKLAAIGASWGQSPAEDALPDKIIGDPVGSPLRDIDVMPNGKGVVYFQYLENGLNAFVTDFTKPIGYDQIINGYPSGGIAGGTSVCTDGDQIWILGCTGRQFIQHADCTPFGTQNQIWNKNVYLPDGWVKGLSAWPNKDLGHGILFIAEGGKITETKTENIFEESKTELVDQMVALDGIDAAPLATWKIDHPLGVKVRGDKLFVLRGSGEVFEVLSLPLDGGWKQAGFSRVFTVPKGIKPFDIEVDSHGRIYLSDSAANHVYQFSPEGRPLLKYGRLDAQREGHYDPETFMMPEKLGCWTDAAGQDRLLVVEMGGPNRLSEWSGDDGKMIRQWVVPQTKSNDGYAVDPRHPDLVYMSGQENSLVRWKVNYLSGQWTPQAVWTHFQTVSDSEREVLPSPLFDLAIPHLIYRGDDVYLAFWRGYMIYHLEGDLWRPCAGIFYQKDKNQYYLWRDSNGDGKAQEDEYLPFATVPPPGVFARYFGATWLDDLSFASIGTQTFDVWRLPPASFDKKGTPNFAPDGWKKILTDNIFKAKQDGTATATYGGNEIGTGFTSDWSSVIVPDKNDVYISARSGPDITANYGSQYKLSRYVLDGKDGYKQLWRVGRMTIDGNAKPGEVYGPIYVSPPQNGLIGIIDNSRCGVVIYTEEGLYVDTLFPDIRVLASDKVGAYRGPAEYFSGYIYPNRDDGKIYMALGKTMPEIFEAQGWTTAKNPVKKLTTLDKSVVLTADQIASPPDVALQIRGGAAAAHVAQFYPAPGGAPALDGSMKGWEACDPVQFKSGDAQTVEARCLYDPDHLYLRWHARLGHPFELKPLLSPQHIFAHDREADTLGLYLQGDPGATSTNAKPDGRPGDVRFVFGIFKDGQATRPIVVGMYPTWSGPGSAPMTYTSPVGTVSFARVGFVPDVMASYKMDDDGQGFVMAVAIPRAAIPGSPNLNGWKTVGNFDANLGGVNRFWWSNADGSASRETYDEPSEARLYPGSWSTIQCLAIDTLPIRSWMEIGPFGFPGVTKLDYVKDRAEIIKTLNGLTFPPDTTQNMAASYEGDITQTRMTQRKLAWKNVESSVGLVDDEKVLDWTANGDEGTLYLITHIYTPQAADVMLNLTKPDGFLYITGQLNGKPLPQLTENQQVRIDIAQPLSLQAGWNELLIRRDISYATMQLGATLTGDPAVLWKLRISGPPQP